MNSVLNENNKNANAYEYCISKAIPDGSNFYYATLFETAKNKKRLIAFHALLTEFSEIIHECKDPGVARIKLKWWQEEIERMLHQQARHPVTRQLQDSIDITDNLISTVNSVIDFFNHFIFIEQTNSLDAILSLYKSTSGELWLQCHQHLNVDANKPEIIRELGAFVHYLSCLQQPYSYINETRCIIPANIIKSIDLQNLLIDTNKRQQSQKEIFTPLIAEIKNRLEVIQNELKQNKNVIYDLIMTKLLIKTCDEILSDDCNILDRSISLTPLRKLWIAWLTRTFR